MPIGSSTIKPPAPCPGSMMRTTGHFPTTLAALALTAAAVTATGARAQNAGSYQLPPAPTPSATAQGPVVPGSPPPRVATTDAPTVETPPPQAAPPPVIAAPTPTSAPTARPSPRPRPAMTAQPMPAPTTSTASTTALPAPGPSPTGAAALPPPLTQPTLDTPALAPPPLAPAPEPASNPLPWIAGFLLALGAVVGWLLLRRRQTLAEAEPEFERPVVAGKTASPARAPARAPAEPEPKSAPAPRPAPTAPSVSPAAAMQPLDMHLHAARMSASLVNATLAYRLLITADEDVTDLVVRGDMVSAHASRPAEEQLGLSDAPTLHRVDRMSVGETLELSGEIRLPLAAITPIRHGDAALFVPLVRIEALGLSASGKPVKLRAAFVIGLDEGQAGTRLQPFRLDLGPRVYQQVGQRALPVPAFA